MKYNQSATGIIGTMLCSAALLFCQTAAAQIFQLPANGDNIIGEVVETRSQRGDEVSDLARRYNVGVDEVLDANRGLSESLGFRGSSRVTVPSQFILPPGPRTGIVINLSELRLYYYIPGTNQVLTEPIGIGKVGWQTPVGETQVISKTLHPDWHPTQLVRDDAAKKGYILPDVWPAGPDNPLGDHMMRLGWTSYLIHGTNRPQGVGKRSSAGCIRMYPEGIAALYKLVTIGTPVRVIDAPVKVGLSQGQLYVEVHQPLEEKGKIATEDTRNLVQYVTEYTAKHSSYVKWRLVHEVLKGQRGIPVAVGVAMSAAESMDGLE